VKRAIAIVAFVSLAAGCGGGGPMPAQTGAPNKAEEKDEDGGGGSTATPSGTDADKMITTPDAAQKQFDDAQQAFDASGGDCAQMCKALASMQRATDHLCTLAGDDLDGKKRCDDARARVETAEAKVKSSCGGCG
jgi:hypothetical protein